MGQSVSESATVSMAWVGHRGYPQQYPENSLPGLAAALRTGARALEIDVQASADGEPVVFHDTDLLRVTGRPGALADHTAEALQRISAHEPDRFGARFDPCPIAHLSQVVDLLREVPDARLFVELKPEVFDRWPRARFLARVWQVLEPIRAQCVLISFDLLVLRLAQDAYGCPVGWVLSHYDRLAHARLRHRPVDIVICDLRKLPPLPEPLWSGPWQWFVYDVVLPEQVAECRARSVHWLETWDVGAMIETFGIRPAANPTEALP